MYKFSIVFISEKFCLLWYKSSFKQAHLLLEDKHKHLYYGYCWMFKQGLCGSVFNDINLL